MKSSNLQVHYIKLPENKRKQTNDNCVRVNLGDINILSFNISGFDWDQGIRKFDFFLRVTDDQTIIDTPIRVYVDPINEFSPVFNPKNIDFIRLWEDLEPGWPITPAFRADDADASPHNIVNYEFDSKFNFN